MQAFNLIYANRCGRTWVTVGNTPTHYDVINFDIIEERNCRPTWCTFWYFIVVKFQCKWISVQNTRYFIQRDIIDLTISLKWFAEFDREVSVATGKHLNPGILQDPFACSQHSCIYTWEVWFSAAISPAYDPHQTWCSINCAHCSHWTTRITWKYNFHSLIHLLWIDV